MPGYTILVLAVIVIVTVLVLYKVWYDRFFSVREKMCYSFITFICAFIYFGFIILVINHWQITGFF